MPEPKGTGLGRKLGLTLWVPRYLPAIWSAVQLADVVHTPVPGDVGALGLLVALIQRKRIYVRHCGTWGARTTLADRFLLWLLERIAGGRSVVLATGNSASEPSRKNPDVHWIFSTSLTILEMERLSRAVPWRLGQQLRLITVSRLTPAKNIQAIVGALPAIARIYPDVCLDVLGDGEHRSQLEAMAVRLGVRERVVFHGNVSHEKVLNALAGASVFVFPTQVNEGFPKAILEALACGLPIVASKVSVIPSLIRDCGHLLDTADAENVASTVLQMMKDEKMLRDVGERAHERARRYTLEAWQAEIRRHLTTAWGVGLREHT